MVLVSPKGWQMARNLSRLTVTIVRMELTVTALVKKVAGNLSKVPGVLVPHCGITEKKKKNKRRGVKRTFWQ